ncbi:hypothetical protein CMI47_14655 [Candidatus Pacearchaeota archaeon]|nr:hypothetical protein [Candidatus Pacearchaeota archaeon]|tara:strand:+ start:1426 stop:1938 length:513 start_codon:yes stop_codon:yes gene_type:complete
MSFLKNLSITKAVGIAAIAGMLVAGTVTVAEEGENRRKNRRERIEEHIPVSSEVRFNFRQRNFVQRTVTSWFIASFSLDISDEEFLRLRDVYARVISKSGVIFKGYADNPNNISPSEKKNTKGEYETIVEEFTNQVKQTIGVEKYNLLVSMTDDKRDGSMMRFRRGRRVE